MTACLDKIGKEDKNGGPYYNGFDRVRMEKVYTDTVEKKEKRLIKYNPFFNMNLMRPLDGPGRATPHISHNRMEFFAEKVEKKSPEERMNPPPLGAFEMEVVDHLKRGPPEKFDIPTCTSHEIGWLLNHPMHYKRIRQTGGGYTRAPMLERNQFDEGARHSHLKRCKSEPKALSPMLAELNTPATKPARAQRRRSEMHLYAENYYNCMHANPFQKTQPLARGG